MARRAAGILRTGNRLGAAALVGAASFLPLGCSSSGGDSSSSSSSSSSGGAPDAAAGDPTILVGTFQVRSTPPVTGTPGSSSLIGKIYDGPTPSQIVWEAKTKEGDCQLSTPRVPFCNTPCGGSAVCVEDDTCKPYPSAHSAGNVKVTGLLVASNAAELVMSPTANNYQPPAGTTLSYPAFSEGADIRFEATGDYFSAFTLEAKGIAPLALLNDTIQIGGDKGVKLTWTPPGKAGISKIHVKLDISHHGGTKGMLECDTEDTGSLELSASLLKQLLDLGVAGYPTIIVTRRAVGSTTIAPGRVDLLISSEIERAVSVDGLTSCSADTDCASGKTCQSDLTCK